MRLYGLTEIADEVGIGRGTVDQWRHRGKLPPPDYVVSGTPIWKASTIRPFVERMRRSPA